MYPLLEQSRDILNDKTKNRCEKLSWKRIRKKMKFFRKRHRQLCLVALGRDDVIDLVTDGSLHDLLLDSDIALFSSCNLVPSELTVPQGDIFGMYDNEHVYILRVYCS